MNQRNLEKGSMNVLLIPLILVTILFFAAAGFATWAFSERQDYKNNSDQKAKKAADIAARQTSSEKDNEFLEREKEPLKKFEGPAELGSVQLNYPKTWSGYVTIAEGSSEFVFNPNVVQAAENAVYALRISVVQDSYENSVREFDGVVEEGKAKSQVYKLPKMKDVTGVRINGEIGEGKQGSIVILPLRDKTLKIAVESQNYIKDFDKIILPNFSFKP